MFIESLNVKAVLIISLLIIFVGGLIITKKTEKQEQKKILLSPKPASSISPSFQATPYPSINQPNQENYLLQYAEGECDTNSQCVYIEYGCGGGHGRCTTTPDKYKDMMTTCDYNPDFPAFLGYNCQCISSLGQCGWVK
ncbi:hypothetical protein A3J78_00865 [Candidatus Beckwithbacteria bacterium RBG_13_35_6]|uniref:Transmembrane protein n=1 Tax=Candidatus Beckwithbacteria bacterium RBG_13_35_6 TaxID=1797456 RepID=A0A1F5DDK1_9BACT|nr:MAG: hypothetical protein A3J78_00865 [Candidatus Beckwithbacteria bacterium RBG_13_35_6]